MEFILVYSPELTYMLHRHCNVQPRTESCSKIVSLASHQKEQNQKNKNNRKNHKTISIFPCASDAAKPFQRMRNILSNVY